MEKQDRSQSQKRKPTASKNIYLNVYTTAHNNAVDLLQEAKLLLKHRHFARAYALAFTALEEIAKSQFAADVFTRFCKPEDFEKFYRDHRAKISSLKWAHLDANSFAYNLKWIGPDIDDVERMSPDEPIFHKRQAAMFVDVDFQTKKVTAPTDSLTQKDAEDIIHIVETAIARIWEVTEYWGHQIGTKGFLK